MKDKLYSVLFHAACIAVGAACFAVVASALLAIFFAVRYLPEWFSLANVIAAASVIFACWITGYQFLKMERD